MNLAKLNLALGGLFIILAGFGGMALGASYEANFKDGLYLIDISHAFLKAGHTHGMALALFNLIAGLLVHRLPLSDKGKKWCSWLAAGALIMPVGLMLRGLTGGSMMFAPLGFLGAFCFLGSALIIIKGGLNAAGPDK